MKDLFKGVAEIYSQTPTKNLTLIPAINRSIPKNLNRSKERKLLDIACGTGDFLKILNSHGYKYHGFDGSKSMLDVAKKRHPFANFKLLSTTGFAKHYKTKFDVVLANMIIHTLDKNEIQKTIEQIKKVSKKKTLIVIGIPNPNFDHYMRFGLFKKTGIKTNFKGYFKSKQKYVLRYMYKNKSIKFVANHWTLQDYLNFFLKANLKIIKIDECRPTKKVKNITKKKIEQKNLYPTYMVITLQNN